VDGDADLHVGGRLDVGVACGLFESRLGLPEILMLEIIVYLLSSPALVFVPVLLAFPVFAVVVTRMSDRTQRYSPVPFALVNLAGAFALCVSATQIALKANFPDLTTVKAAVLPFLAYLATVFLSYALLMRSKRRGGKWVYAALWAPLLVLIAIKYLPVNAVSASRSGARTFPDPAIVFVGLSYLSFRLCYLVQEVLNDVVALPSIWDYLSFAFFVPTMTVGPISPFRLFIGSLRAPDRVKTPIAGSLQRIVVGLTKFIFFSTLLSQYGYASLLLDGHPHIKLDLAIAVLTYPMYLYCNFSGLCDMVIGVSGLMGIEVMENFDRPFYSRNFQVFWSRWHISLSTFMRDMMFTPLVKWLAGRFGARNLNHAIAASILGVFVVIGLWHGAGINFLLFGISQGLGVVAIHYATIAMKKRLGRAGFAAYQKNRAIYVVACSCTYLYFALSLFLFANTWDQMRKIFSVLV
jgi:D-alanyl-lipoteichoic acid acyltransferase DltB (MBOAT superfamily)